MSEKDITEKTLEAYNDVFADIVNGLLFQGEGIVQEEKLVDAQPVSMYKADGKLHEQERDVAKLWYGGQDEQASIRIAFLGAENQTKYDKDMVLRVLGYDGAAYRAELSQDGRYPVITLVLYFGDTPWGETRTLYETISVPGELTPFVSDYRINVFEIARLPEAAINWFTSDFRIVVDFFIHKVTEPDYRPEDPVKFRHVDELLKLMSVLTKDERFVETLNGEGDKPKDMCELLDRIEAKGIEQGIQQGVDKTRIESIKSLMEKMNLTAVQAMEMLDIPPSDQRKYVIML